MGTGCFEAVFKFDSDFSVGGNFDLNSAIVQPSLVDFEENFSSRRGITAGRFHFAGDPDRSTEDGEFP